jgi:tripartite ATP-independent transporter DctP family solute receptor
MVSAQGKVYELKLAHADSTDPTVSRKHAQALVFANLVNTRSGGQINVKVYGGGALGAEREYVEGIKAGTVEAGIASGVVSNFFPSAMVTDIPFLFPSGEVAWSVMDGPFGDKLRAMFLQQTGMRCLSFAEVGFRHFTNNTRPIKSPADMKGLKIRVQETPLYVNMLKALGASPTPIAWTETYTALQTKVVDGQENPIPTILMAKFPEVQKYITLDGHVYGVDWFIINEKFFKSLPAELQYIVLDCSQISSTVGRGVQTYVASQGLQALIDQKMVVYSPTEAELDQFKSIAQPAVIDWLKTKIDPKLIDEILKNVQDVINAQKASIK